MPDDDAAVPELDQLTRQAAQSTRFCALVKPDIDAAQLAWCRSPAAELVMLADAPVAYGLIA